MNLKNRIDKIMSNLPLSTFLSTFNITDKRIPYIQHIPEEFEKTQTEFIKICIDVLKHDHGFVSLCEMALTEDKIYRQGIIGRYLEDCGVNELYLTWNRFMCTDEKYREWEQPYFVNSEPDHRNIICLNQIEPELIKYFRDKKIDNLLK